MWKAVKKEVEKHYRDYGYNSDLTIIFKIIKLLYKTWWQNGIWFL